MPTGSFRSLIIPNFGLPFSPKPRSFIRKERKKKKKQKMAPENHLSVRAVLAGLLAASGPGVVAAVPNGRLHELATAAGKLYFGTAVDNPEIKDNTYKTILGNKFDFGQVTVGNTQKWQFTEPNQGKFDYRQADEIVNFAKSNGQQIVRCHTLVWHNQLPSWVESGNWNRDSLTRVINTHVSNVVGHYKGQCYAWDVVNEALEDNGNFRNSVFYRVLGTDYLPIAFKAAAAADANTKLYYNDYNIEQAGNKQQQALKIVDIIKRGGARIDGVGLQGHFIVGQTGSRDQLAAVLNSFVAKGVDVAYTEVDVRHSSLPPNARALQQQADDYGNIVGACLAVKRCVGITVWGASDAHSWIPSVFPGQGAATLLDANNNPKPAYNKVRDVLGAAGQNAGGQVRRRRSRRARQARKARAVKA
ncbi:endo-1,4-beta-xylanase [Magnaporthiopsis poae ATCC 64411]|uniref:Beta-xylanase n=1 Tax=Magnaporthiopsis poae (strain ATCC 64411 / 73-15) TaxID=644358 RepID=A0A0C4E871_MAGP6|nr:endo-1,4-beta-xylanase [Magnaporthiopsis poae ATCC 64411]